MEAFPMEIDKNDTGLLLVDHSSIVIDFSY